jgi:hypothetical protein
VLTFVSLSLKNFWVDALSIASLEMVFFESLFRETDPRWDTDLLWDTDSDENAVAVLRATTSACRSQSYPTGRCPACTGTPETTS